MNRTRRAFLSSGATAVAGCLYGPAVIGRSDNPVTKDRFGGWTGRSFEATGFFRLEKADRWWLVTPDGNAFLSWGINHLYPDLWRQDYNQAAWKQKLGLDSLKGAAFNTALRNWFLQTCEQFGFNTVGVHNSLAVINSPQPRVPYMQPLHFVDTPHWKSDVPDENFVDVFAEDFRQHCFAVAEKMVAPVRNDPFLLGYSMTDCTMFTEEDLRERPDVIGGSRRAARIGWPRRLRNLGEVSAGKQAWVAAMRDVYADSITAFNRTYDTDFDSFQSLTAAENWRPQTQLSNPAETRDNTVFLQRCVSQYYETAVAAIRHFDTNHLFFGDKINANTDSLDTVLPVTSRYTDAILYQMYGRFEVQRPGLDRWRQLTDKPFLNGDSAFTMTTDTMPRPYGPVADNVTQRAEWTGEFFTQAFERPDFIGWHYCGLIDAPNLVPRKKARQHSGLLDGYGDAYPALQRVLRQSADRLYEISQNSLR